MNSLEAKESYAGTWFSFWVEIKYADILEKSTHILPLTTKAEAAEVHGYMGIGWAHLLPRPGRWSRGEWAAGQAAIRTVCLLHCPLTCIFEHFKSRQIQTTYLSHFLVGSLIFFLAHRLCNEVYWGPGRISPHCPHCYVIWDESSSPPPSNAEWAGRPAPALAFSMKTNFAFSLGMVSWSINDIFLTWTLATVIRRGRHELFYSQLQVEENRMKPLPFQSISSRCPFRQCWHRLQPSGEGSRR